MRELCASAANVDNRIVLHSRPLNLRNEFHKYFPSTHCRWQIGRSSYACNFRKLREMTPMVKWKTIEASQIPVIVRQDKDLSRRLIVECKVTCFSVICNLWFDDGEHCCWGEFP